MLTNLRGFRSKKTSLKNLVRREKPAIILMNETQLVGKMRVKLDQYTCWTKNRTVQKGGGIATAVSRQYSNMTVAAGEGREGDEYMITRLESFTPALNVINCYGEQRKCKKEEVEEKWARLKKEMLEIEARQENCILAGDLNKLVGNDELGVEGNHEEITLGGKLLREMLRRGDWILVNSMGDEIVEGGPFTREDPASGGLSCLDLFVVNRRLKRYVSKLSIDSKRKKAVANIVKRKGKLKVTYSDHFTVTLELKDLPRQKVKEKKIKMWNLAKKDGWKRYKELTENVKIEDIMKDENTDVLEAVANFEKMHEKMKFQAFGKVTVGKNSQGKNDEANDDMDQEKRAEEMFEEEVQAAEKEIEEIRQSKGGKVGKMGNKKESVWWEEKRD